MPPLSTIARANNQPALTDQLVGITGGVTDNLFTLAQVGSTTAPSYSITRSQIPTITISVSAFAVSGYSTAGDLGTGAVYTSVGAGPSGPMAIQDASGTWFNLVVIDAADIGYFGATGNGSTNDSAAIQAAIDYMASLGGGIVKVPLNKTYVCNVVLKPYVQIVGATIRSTTGAPTFQAAATGVVIDTPGPQMFHSGIIGIQINGLGAGTPCKAIRFQSCWWSQIKEVFISSFADEGILLDSGCVACVLTDNLIENAVLNRTRSAVTGACDVGGSDHYLSQNEFTTSSNSVSSSNLYVVALAWRASASFLHSTVGEFADVGIWTGGGGQNMWVDCRADHNYGHGFSIGTADSFVGCLSLNNSLGTTNTYDHFFITGTNGLYSNCVCGWTGGNQCRYGFNDQSNGDANKNRHVNPACATTTVATAPFSFQAASSAIFFPSGAGKSISNPGSSFDVNSYSDFTLSNSSPTTLAGFSNGTPSQIVRLTPADGNTTITHGGGVANTFNLWHQGTMLLRANIVYTFYFIGTLWELIGFDPTTLNIGTATYGDVDATITWLTDAPTQVWNSPISTSRACSINNPGPGGQAIGGMQFRIVRTAAATGAFNLFINAPGTVKTLAAGQWCDVEWVAGLGWTETAFGSL